MTLGDKIKKYRKLKGMTQKELGEAIGFPSSTADSRIRKYEGNHMAPKADIRNKLAETLDVDISAISDIRIKDYSDVMQILFYFEEEFGMNIDRNEKTTTLIFDNNDINNKLLSSYLYTWFNQKNSIQNTSNSYSDEILEYKKWEARFPKDINEYWTQQIKKIDSLYDPLIKDLDRKKITNMSELIQQLRQLIELGFTVQTYTKSNHRNIDSIMISFLVHEILDTSNSSRTTCFSELLYDFNTLQEYGIELKKELTTDETGTKISYILFGSQLLPVSTEVEKINTFIANKATYNDYEIESFEKAYNNKLKQNDVDLTKSN